MSLAVVGDVSRVSVNRGRHADDCWHPPMTAMCRVKQGAVCPTLVLFCAARSVRGPRLSKAVVRGDEPGGRFEHFKDVDLHAVTEVVFRHDRIEGAASSRAS